MLVPGMSIFAVKNDVLKDYPAVLNEAMGRSKLLSNIYKPTKDTKVERIFDYMSLNRNHWLYKVYVAKKKQLYQFMAYYFDDKGLVAVSTTDKSDYLLFFTPHFFKRYNERSYLNHILQEDIARSFMSDNTGFSIEILEAVSKDVSKFFCVTQKGVILGNCNTCLKVCYMNTFISHEMLLGNQVKLEGQLKVRLDILLKEMEIKR